MRFSILSILVIIGFSTDTYAMDVEEYKGIPLRPAPFSKLHINDEVWSVSIINLSQWKLSNLHEEKKDMHTALLFEGVGTGNLKIDSFEQNKPTFQLDDHGFWKLFIDFRVFGDDPGFFDEGKGAVCYINTSEANGLLETRCHSKGFSEYKELMSSTLLKTDVLHAIEEVYKNQSKLGYSRGTSIDPESAEMGIFSCSTFADAVLRCCGFFTIESTRSRELLNKGNYAGITPKSFRTYYKDEYYYVPSNQNKWNELLPFQKRQDSRISQREREDAHKLYTANVLGTLFTSTDLAKSATALHATMSIGQKVGQKVLELGKKLENCILNKVLPKFEECKDCNELSDRYRELHYDINSSSLDFSSIQNLNTAFTIDDVNVQYRIARVYDKGGYQEKAIKWYKKAADQGHLKSFYRLGWLYYHLKNYDNALIYLKKAVDRKHAASFNLRGAIAHEAGEYALAKECYEKAANQGVSDAQYNLGILHEEGKGVPVNDEVAKYWYKQAEEQDFKKAQSMPNFMNCQEKTDMFAESSVNFNLNSNNEEKATNEIRKLFKSPQKKKIIHSQGGENIF